MKGYKLAHNLFRAGKKFDIFSIQIDKVKTPIFLRRGTTDVTNFLENFMRAEFSLPQDFQPKLIIDAGANVGFASLWFLQRFPNTEIIAIEPESSNCEMLKKN